jgi:hypothetical protein
LLIARPRVSVDDFFIASDLVDNYENGFFHADVDICNFSENKSDLHCVKLSLLDDHQHAIFTDSFQVDVDSKKAEK